MTAQLEAAIERRTDTRGDAFTTAWTGRRTASEPTPPPACAACCTPRSPRPGKAPAPATMTGSSARSAGSPSSPLRPGAPATRCGRTCTQVDGVPVPAVRISQTELGLTSDKPPVGLITRLENKLADLAADRDKVLRRKSAASRRTERARAAVSTPFADADKLSRARARSDRLADELSGQPSAAPPPAPLPARHRTSARRRRTG